MLSDANREIRASLDESDERRLHRSPYLIAFEYLDELIAELEELHLRDHVYLPAAFDQKFVVLDRLLSDDVKRPRSWPTRIRRVIDACFDLQEQLQVLRGREQSRVLIDENPDRSRETKFIH
jgi:hypothetical protein